MKLKTKGEAMTSKYLMLETTMSNHYVRLPLEFVLELLAAPIYQRVDDEWKHVTNEDDTGISYEVVRAERLEYVDDKDAPDYTAQALWNAAKLGHEHATRVLTEMQPKGKGDK
jgi:hypothetical protein